MRIEIYPLDKVLIDEAAIHFGMEQAAVESTIGKGQLMQGRYYYYNHEMALEYRAGKLAFIEFLGGIDGMLKPIIYDTSTFETKANELLEILKAKNNGVIGDYENGYSYEFYDISVGIYREAVPHEVEEMIQQATNLCKPMTDKEIEQEMKRANFWATIGAGISGYYQR